MYILNMLKWEEITQVVADYDKDCIQAAKNMLNDLWAGSLVNRNE